jgi:hypothetical protein
METAVERVRVEKFVPWPLTWSGVWAGALAALALALILGLVGIAIGAHRAGGSFGTWSEVSFLALASSVLGSFLAFALGGWVAARVAGARRSETAMLHGALAWLVAVPLLVVLASLGAASYFGGWYGGLAGLPPAAAAQAHAAAQDPAAAQAARHAALAAVTALLLGLMGSVVGGWMGSGEPMTFTHYRTRRERAAAGGW